MVALETNEDPETEVKMEGESPKRLLLSHGQGDFPRSPHYFWNDYCTVVIGTGVCMFTFMHVLDENEP